MATATEERPEGGLRFFSLKGMERRGVMLEASALMRLLVRRGLIFARAAHMD